jgi:DNA-binding CsgD family transcriptional regulator
MGENEMAFLGVPAEEERIYRHFLRHPHSPVREMYAALGTGAAAAAPRLRRLARLGLLRESAPGRMAAADPETAVARLVDARLRDLRAQVPTPAGIRAVTQALFAEQGAPPPPRGVEHLVGREIIRTRIEDWAFRARDEVLSLAPLAELSPAYLSYVRPIALGCLRRGVRFRSVMLTGAERHGPTAAYLREITGHGAEVRLIPDASERMLASDRRVVIVPHHGGRVEDGALLTEEPGIVASVLGLFERTWSQAEPFPARPAPGRARRAVPELPEAERRVLEAMCSGRIDEAAARAVGVSVRTYRRRVAALMRLLGAGSRAQAALLARDRGWI